MTEFERALTREHCRRWWRSPKAQLEFLGGLLTVATLLLLIASLAHVESIMKSIDDDYMVASGSSLTAN